MLRDIVSYGGKTILTIFHDNSELDVKDRYWIEKEKIGRFNAVFEESSADIDIDEITAGKDIEKAIIPYNNELSPNGSAKITTLMKRIRNSEKPPTIFNKDSLDIKLSRDNWLKLCGFVKKYTGMDILRHAMSCGDVFIFHYCGLEYKKEKDGSIRAKQNGYDSIAVNFKAGNLICDHVIIEGEGCKAEDLIFKSDSDWDSIDFYGFSEGDLVFYAPDIIFMEALEFDLSFGSKRKVPLNNKYNVQYSNSGDHEKITIGESRKTLRRLQDIKEAELYKRYSADEANGKNLISDNIKAYFISIGQADKVYNVANLVLDKGWDEIYFHDPFFSDFQRSKPNDIIDWVRLLCNGNIKKVHIVFTNKKDEDFDKLEKLISNDWTVLQQLNKGIEIDLIGMKTYVHDRFLLCRNEKQYGGLYFGTSVNSLNDNYYYLFDMGGIFSKVCWSNLYGIMINDSIRKVELKRNGQ